MCQVMKITLEEIAKMAGVSKATVSRVLNSAPGVGAETRKRVQEVIQRVHYSNNGIQLKMYSKSIALVVPDIANPFFASIACSIERKARSEGYIVILANTDSSEKQELEYISNLIAKKVDGIILIPSGSQCRKAHLLPHKYGIPMVLLDRGLEGLDPDCYVYSDNEYAAFRSCELFIRNGAKEIAFISGPLDVSTSQERLDGYRIAMKQYGLPYSEDHIKIGNYTVESGYNAIMDLVRSGTPFTEVLAANDLMALGAVRALKELSFRIPEDIEIIGFDNIMFSYYLDPPLSTVQQASVEMGAVATHELVKLIHGMTVKKRIILQPRLVLRKTTR